MNDNTFHNVDTSNVKAEPRRNDGSEIKPESNTGVGSSDLLGDSVCILNHPIDTKILQQITQNEEWHLVASYLGQGNYKSQMVLVKNTPNLILKGITSLSELESIRTAISQSKRGLAVSAFGVPRSIESFSTEGHYCL